MAKEQPLWLRLYFDPVYTEVVRLVGYGGFPEDEVEKRIEPLVQRFGHGEVESALWRLTTYRKPECGPTVRLGLDVKPLCWQLLGPPREHPEYAHAKSADPWCPPWWRAEQPAKEEPKPEEPKPKPKRQRKPKAT